MVVGFSSGLRACSKLTVVFEYLDITSWGGTFTGSPMLKIIAIAPRQSQSA
jgi:hypothetical protein